MNYYCLQGLNCVFAFEDFERRGKGLAGYGIYGKIR
jgi:hypothetical protein